MLAKCLLLEYRRAWFSELSFSRISESTTGYTHICGIFYFPWHIHQIEGTTSILVSLPKGIGNVRWMKLPRDIKQVYMFSTYEMGNTYYT